MNTGFELKYPTAQNAVDIVPKWTSAFPAAAGVHAGYMDLFNDTRIDWAIKKFGGDLAGRNVLELGPLEGAHTTTLTRCGANVDAVEASRVAFVKCLITKEILRLQNAHFYLGDCVLWAENPPRRYDLVIACGLLYHMVEPLRLLRALSELTDDLFVWTVYVDDADRPPTRVETFGDLDIKTYAITYGPRDIGFTGGAQTEVYWMDKSAILGTLSRLGFDDIEVSHDRPDGLDGGPSTFAVYARRTNATR